jgi:membrane fusion protein (multidrug efflux system)
MAPTRLIMPLAVSLLTGLLLLGCKDKPQGPPAQGSAKTPPPMEVGTIAITSQPLPLTVELPGRIAALRVAEVRPQVSGIVQKRLFLEGSEVKSGELLYQIDPTSYQAALAGAEASLAKAEASEYSARLRDQRFQALAKNRAVSEQEQIDAEATWKQALAEVAAAKAAVQKARINLDYTRVIAPIAGRIGKSQISEGALVTAQQATALAVIQQLDRVYVDVSQSAGELLQLKKKFATSPSAGEQPLTTSVRVVLDDDSLYGENGILEFSDVAVDQGTGTVIIRGIIANPRHELLPGMFVRARLSSERAEQTILVPQAAIARNTRGQAMVMVVGDESKVAARPVETGQNVGDKIVIAKGLAEGEQVIVSGLQKIKPGATVKISAPQQTGASPSPAAKKSE